MISKSYLKKLDQIADINDLNLLIKSELNKFDSELTVHVIDTSNSRKYFSSIKRKLCNQILIQAKEFFLYSQRYLLQDINEKRLGIYQDFVDGLSLFLDLEFLALFATTDTSDSALLPCISLFDENASNLSKLDIHINWKKLPFRFPKGNSFTVFRIKPLQQCFRGIKGNNLNKLPQNGKVLVCQQSDGIKCSAIFTAKNLYYVRSSFTEEVIKGQLSLILLPLLHHKRVSEADASSRSIFSLIAHNHKNGLHNAIRLLSDVKWEFDKKKQINPKKINDLVSTLEQALYSLSKGMDFLRQSNDFNALPNNRLQGTAQKARHP